jgi:hypothetical protein
MDLKTNYVDALCIAPAVYNATKDDGTIIDLTDCHSIRAIISTGAIVGAGVFVPTIVMGDAANLSDGVAIPADRLIGTLPAALAENTLYSVGYMGDLKRYARVVLTKTGGTSIAASAAIVKGDLKLAGTV